MDQRDSFSTMTLACDAVKLVIYAQCLGCRRLAAHGTASCSSQLRSQSGIVNTHATIIAEHQSCQVHGWCIDNDCSMMVLLRRCHHTFFGIPNLCRYVHKCIPNLHTYLHQRQTKCPAFLPACVASAQQAAGGHNHYLYSTVEQTANTFTAVRGQAYLQMDCLIRQAPLWI
jgi:hypothetical protein